MLAGLFIGIGVLVFMALIVGGVSLQEYLYWSSLKAWQNIIILIIYVLLAFSLYGGLLQILFGRV